MTDPADISSDELEVSSGDINIMQGEHGGTIIYSIEGDHAVIISLSGDVDITQADLDEFKHNNPDLVEALESDNVTVPIVEDHVGSLEPEGRAS